MRRNTLRIQGFLGNIITHSPKWGVRGLVFTLVFLSTLISLRAEIYKWQDETGAMRYSNKPPAGPAQLPEQSPPQTLPPGTDSDGRAYYLSQPGENAGKSPASPEIPPMKVPADVLNQLKQAATVSPLSSVSQTPLDSTALTIRLAEIEKALMHEKVNRMQTEQESAQTQAFIKQLQNQNNTLKLALTQMENELQNLRGTVTTSDARPIAPKDTPPQQLALLENKVDDLQGQLRAITEATPRAPTQDKKLDTLDAKLATLESKLALLDDLAVSEKFTTLTNDLHELQLQQQPEYDLRVKLAALDTTVAQLVDAIPTSDGTEVVAKLVEDSKMWKTVAEHQTRQISDQQTQLETLRAEIEQLKAQPSAAPAAKGIFPTTVAENIMPKAVSGDVAVMIAGLVEKNVFLEAVIKHQTNVLNTQNEHFKEIEARLAQLQSPAQTLQTQPVFTISSSLFQPDEADASLMSGIKIVERKARRESPREILSWLLK